MDSAASLKNYIKPNRLYSSGFLTIQLYIFPLLAIKSFIIKFWAFFVFGFGIAVILYLVSRIKANKLNEMQSRVDLDMKVKSSQLIRETEKLRDANASKDRLFTIISHDLRSSAIALSKISEKIKYLISQKRTEDLILLGDSLNRNANNLLDLLDNLLTWSLQEQNQVTYSPVKLDLRELIEKAIDLNRDLIESKQLQVILELEESSCAYADINAIKTVLRNVINNAIKYSYPNSKVILISSSAQNRVVLSVSDSGRGMSEQQIRDVMSGNILAGTAGTSGEEGTGLGLVISKLLLEQNKSTLSISSAKNAGTRVDINLPEHRPEYGES